MASSAIVVIRPGNGMRQKMRNALQIACVALLASAMALAAGGQAPAPASGEVPGQPDAASAARSAAPVTAPMAIEVPVEPPATPAVQQLLDFKNSDVKFDLSGLMEILRDRRHEGWVLAAYPDPKTSQPLIGAGFSLDLPAREHPQRDALNPHPFLGPSSAELWQGAGLD